MFVRVIGAYSREAGPKGLASSKVSIGTAHRSLKPGPKAAIFWGRKFPNYFYKIPKKIFHLVKPNFTHFMNRNIICIQTIII